MQEWLEKAEEKFGASLEQAEQRWAANLKQAEEKWAMEHQAYSELQDRWLDVRMITLADLTSRRTG
jgi:hypothetical protein